jgi:hypothetical protein
MDSRDSRIVCVCFASRFAAQPDLPSWPLARRRSMDSTA